jgi:hypothetical protein
MTAPFRPWFWLLAVFALLWFVSVLPDLIESRAAYRVTLMVMGR